VWNYQSMSQFLIFKRLHTAEQAAEIASLLQQHNIPVEQEEEIQLMDKIYIGQNFDQRFLIKIPADLFLKADALLKSQIEISTEDLDPDYYMLSFSKEELTEVIVKKDEWGDFDYALALKLLEKQGISYTPEQLNTLGNKRLDNLSKPQDLPGIWLFIGYLSPVTIFAPVPYPIIYSLIGIVLGVFVWTAKKTLPNGERVAAFSEKTQWHGKWMIIFGFVLSVICWILLAELKNN
jgi:hypothetical protein